ncbi:hypothetical protein SLEP1_g21452 [Rubroshorea leprosula]|uniref:Uncharacterized protein n=1 Tax=Rubroshorea leprosula TaxID=152421 RepID=A0AAV5JF85_9ROSI|nr:hypothetical protein SLEP1_g21452 [Rubroshorea leprosula]
MERKLNQIRLDSYHLKVKLVDNMRKGREVIALELSKQSGKQWVRKDRKVSPGVSYAQVVVGRVLILCDDKSKISKTIILRVNGEVFSIVVMEEEWCMDSNWWLAGERRNPVVFEDGTEYSDEGNNEDIFNANSFLGDDGKKKAEDCGVTVVDSNGQLRRLVDSNEVDLDEFFESNGLQKHGPVDMDFVGPNEMRLDVQRVEESYSNGLMSNSAKQQQMASKKKKSRSLGVLYPEVGGFSVNRMRKRCSFVNVCAPCERHKKILLWKEIGDLVVEEGGRWLLARGFNSVRNIDERKGKMTETQGMHDFNQFVEGTRLIDVNLMNRKFMWYRPDGTSMSRIDRFLMSAEMSLLATDCSQVGVRRTISDHCAIILKSRNIDWAPKPFWVFDAWQQHPDFRRFVEDRWKELHVEGWAAYKCKQK